MLFGQQPGNFDAIVLNDNLEDAYTRLIAVLDKLYPEYNLAKKT
jgi:hypothetical protein